MPQASPLALSIAREHFSGAGIRTFSNISECWALSVQQQMALLGIESRSTLYRWKAQARKRRKINLSRDTLERISYILGIFKAINILLPVEARADLWLRAANDCPLFGGGSALERMTSGRVSDLFVVRRYLDAELNPGL